MTAKAIQSERRRPWKEAGPALDAALSRPLVPGSMRLLTVPAPPARFETLLRHDLSQDGILFDSPAGIRAAGLGTAVVVEAEGRSRFEQVRGALLDLLAHTDAEGLLGSSAERARLFGGFAFAPGWRDAVWEGFGDARFVLPRWTYLRRGGEATLTLALGAEERAAKDAWIAETLRILRVLEADASAPPQGIWQAPLDELPPADWHRMVEEARQAILDGRFEKIVLSRRTRAHLPFPIEAAEILERLGAEHPDCFRFAVRVGGACGATFLGAPPERLIAKEGDRIRADCLAGSIAAPETAGESTRSQRALDLLASEKDRIEHRVVVDAVREALVPFCRTLAQAEVPQVMQLRHVLHLHTPVTGVLARSAHVLDLVEALHPTPAVGGVPQAPAVEFIAEHEPVPRGWYAGPVGFVDAEGDGEFAVAIRSGLVRGREAYLHAGAGIVRASDPHQEWRETAVKQRALLRALGIGG